jgi:hypothetical protein
MMGRSVLYSRPRASSLALCNSDEPWLVNP